MPSVEVQYKDAGALKFLKLLSTYFGFKVLEKKSDPQKPDLPPGQVDDNWQPHIIPGDKDRKYEAFLSTKNLDASSLRRDLWKRG